VALQQNRSGPGVEALLAVSIVAGAYLVRAFSCR
jgi:hypothetical protein